MRNTHRCPKCASLDIARVPSSGTSYEPHVPVSAFSSVPLTTYVCTNCGFTEQWVDDPTSAAKIARKFLTVQPDRS